MTTRLADRPAEEQIQIMATRLRNWNYDQYDLAQDFFDIPHREIDRELIPDEDDRTNPHAEALTINHGCYYQLFSFMSQEACRALMETRTFTLSSLQHSSPEEREQVIDETTRAAIELLTLQPA